MRHILASIVLAGSLAASPIAWSQNNANTYQLDLHALSEYLGALHYLRGQCQDDERTYWRDSMKELIRQENPSRRQAREMTEKFNQGFNAARERFPECSDESEREARIQADLASRLTDSLLATLDQP